ncbi:MAG: hypothetical protein Q7S58_07140 [Candidatus Binatus sp.]|uniref:hypothetical protein n=1 Tax=Candidatus Binatus sp. TaxID=2811406 RepID=UPI002715ABDE|nr:hypothetical protein [Candidatus Binatus sp.]MDO8432171.1 hypothetical protein [Candidatus Binatus sp.]
MEKVATAACESDGSYRMALQPGSYAVVIAEAGDSHLSNPRSKLVTVKSQQWLQIMRGDEDSACCEESISGKKPPYNSGVKGRGPSPQVGCYGVPGPRPNGEVVQCVEAYSPGGDRMVACAACDSSNQSFTMPLAPGEYLIAFDAEKEPGSNAAPRLVTIAPQQWLRVDAKRAGIRAAPCPRLP